MLRHSFLWAVLNLEVSFKNFQRVLANLYQKAFFSHSSVLGKYFNSASEKYPWFSVRYGSKLECNPKIHLFCQYSVRRMMMVVGLKGGGSFEGHM